MNEQAQRRLTVLFVIGSLETGGAERQMVNLAGTLNARGHDASIAVLDRPGELEALADVHGVRVHRLYELPRRKRGILGLLGVVRRVRPDVVHPYLPRNNVRVTLLKWWVKPALLVWGVRASDVDLSRYPLRSRVIWVMSCWLSRFADLVIANSHAGARHHIEAGYPPRTMTVIPNGIDTFEFRPDPDAGRRFREELGIASDVPVLGLLGRFDPMKGHDAFLEILVMVRNSHPTCVGLVVGAHTPAQLAGFRAQARALGVDRSLVVAGRTAEPAAMLNAVDVLVHPSQFGEGFPNVVAEAMACGTPCVAYDVGDAARIIDDQQLLATRGDEATLAEAVSRLLEERPAAEGLRRKIADRFTIEVAARRFEGALSDGKVAARVCDED